MPTAARQRSILGRIWEAQSRLMKLRGQRAELLEDIAAACLAGNIERAYDCAEATTRIDVQLEKARADLELWKNERDFVRSSFWDGGVMEPPDPGFSVRVPSERGI